jgi:sulfur relay (sulfurtransferase) DsrC/TusE family protein
LSIDWKKLEINPSDMMEIHHATVGKQSYPFLVVDNFYQDPAYLRNLALSLDYCRNYRDPICSLLALGPLGSKKIARISTDQSPLCKFLHEHLAHHFISSLEHMTVSLDSLSVFSMVMNAKGEADYDFKFPKGGDLFLKGSIFLNPPEQCKGGIGFYRHKETGLEEYVPFYLLGKQATGKSLAYKEIVTAVKDLGLYENFHDLQEKGILKKYEDCWKILTASCLGATKNIAGGNDIWELIHFVEMKYNRLVLFPGFLLNVEHYQEEWFPESLESRKVMQEIMIPWPT